MLQTLALIQAMEDATGYRASTYEVSVTPMVLFSGAIGSEAVEDTFAPSFGLTLNSTQITPDTELSHSEIRTESKAITEAATLSVFGITLSVATARGLSVAGFALAAAAAIGCCALMEILFLRKGKAARIQARYGSLLIAVDRAPPDDASHWIFVRSFEDLVTLAQRDSRMIMCHEMPEHACHLYFLRDRGMTYLHLVAEGAPRTRAARRERRN